MKQIFVLGSLNVDLVQRVPRMPSLGETLIGENLEIFVGGKGANQACAAARLGGSVTMAGKVGSDPFAERLLAELTESGVDTRLVTTSKGASGTAMIFVLPNGQNTIVISPGANADVSIEFALRAVANVEAGDVLMAQLETPIEAVAAAIHFAFEKGATVILDPAPGRPLDDSLLSSVSILTPNQTEAAILAGDQRPPLTASEAEKAARFLQGRGVHTVIVKMGEQGCLVVTKAETYVESAHEVIVKDTTAAGDTFNGALAAALTRRADLTDAVKFANAAAALSVTRTGAIPSIPRLAEVVAFLRSATPNVG